MEKIATVFLNILLTLITIGSASAAEIVGEAPGINPYRELHSLGEEDGVDPHTGMLKVQHVDLFLPGDGGMDIKVQRRYDTAAKVTDAATLGRKWSLHFGRLTSTGRELEGSWCSSHEYFLYPNKDSLVRPKFELPDGSVHTFVKAEEGYNAATPFNYGGDAYSPQSKQPAEIYISKQRWIAKCADEPSGGLTIFSPDGTRYDVTERENPFTNTWYVKKITDRNGNWLSFSYTKTTPKYSGDTHTPLYLTTIKASDDREVSFDYSPIYSYNLSQSRSSNTSKEQGQVFSAEELEAYNNQQNLSGDTHQTRPAVAEIQAIRTQTRQARFGIPQRITETHKRLKSISSNGQTWTYHYSEIPNYRRMLTGVTRPDGKTWKYDYPAAKISQLTTVYGWLQEVTTPEGGVKKYTYGLFDLYRSTNEIVKVLRVKNKTLIEGGNNVGEWTYSYHLDRDNTDYTVVKGSEGTTVYKYVTSFNTADIYGDVWKTGLPIEIKKCRSDCSNGFVSKTLFEWGKQEISSDSVSKPSRFSARPASKDLVYNAPILLSKIITRDDTTYATQYLEYDQFGNPAIIWEPGQRVDFLTSHLGFPSYYHTNIDDKTQRAQKISYHHNANKWIIGLEKSKTINNKWEISKGFDSHGNVEYVTKYGVKTNYTYHGTGDIASETDANGNTTEYLDYYRGIARTVKQPEEITTRYEVNSTGTIASKTNAKGATTRYTYDVMNRAETISPPIGSQTVIRYEGNQKKVTRGDYENTVQHDGWGKVKESIQKDLNTGNIIRTTFEYDAVGRKTFESYPTNTFYSSNSLFGERYTYDILNRVTSISHPDSSSKTFNYKIENKVEIQNERNKTYVYAYRSYGDPENKELMSVTAPILSASINIERNSIGQKISMSQQGVKHLWEYNNRGFLEKKYIPETGWTEFTHDSVGNVKTKTLAGNKTTYLYDDNYLLKNIVYSDYYTAGRSFSYDNLGNLKSSYSGGTQRLYKYDDNSNLLSETLNIDGLSFVLGYNYNDNDALEGMTYPDITDQKLSFSPDAFGRKTQIDKLGIQISHHPNGVVNSMSYANSITTTQTLNNRQLPERLSVGNIIDMNIDYDGMGNVTNIQDSLYHDANRTLTYDDIGRLESSLSALGEGRFVYDDRGNIHKKPYYSYSNIFSNLTYDNKNRLSGTNVEVNYGGRGYTFWKKKYYYDSNGNVTDDSNLSYSYNAASNLTGVGTTKAGYRYGAMPVGGNYASYKYDANNIRVKKKAFGKSTYFFYAKNGDLILEYTPSKSEFIQYAYHNKKQVAKRKIISGSIDLDKDGKPDASEIRESYNKYVLSKENLAFIHTDTLGSPIAATSHPTGGLLWKHNYSPYGNKNGYSYNSKDDSLWFTGKYQDKEHGLTYLGARYYSTALGRFMGVDPVEPSDDNLHRMNRYAYANNNPYKYVDPSGMTPEALFITDSSAYYDIRADEIGVNPYTLDGSNAVAQHVSDEALLALEALSLFPVARLSLSIKGAPKSTTILGENMKDIVIPYAERTGVRTLPFGTTAAKWNKLTSKQRYKLNDGALRKRINEGDNFKYTGQDRGRNPAERKKFDLTGSELLRLKDRGISYETVTP